MEEYYVFAREAAEAAEAAQDETRRAFDADERTRPAGDYETEDGRHRRFGQGALRAACKIILSAPNGEKHKILYRMSAWMGDLIANYFLNESECAAELLRSILTRGDVEDVRSAEKTILDGLCKGQTNPRPRLPPNPVAPKVIFGKGSKEAVTTVDDDQEDEEDDGAGLNGCQIILRYFRRTYRPIFRRSNTIRCRAGGDVPMAVACAVPNSKLIGQLAAALDAPTYKGGGVNLNALPSFFGSWAKVAWGDLLSELTDEHNYIPKNEKEMASSREEFRIMVRAAMLTEVVIGETIGGEGHTQTERRSLVEWCQRFAKAGPWRAVRSKRCWCKFIERDDGEIIQMVAIRSDIFGQLKADKSLCSLSANRFGRLAKLYGVGESTDENRPEGLAVVVLSQDFLREISGSPHEES